MADLFKSLKHEANPSKSGFDLSRKHVFSSQPGQALPCLSLETVPGDHIEIDLTSLSRTQTFNTAAFVRGKQRFDFFFVPNSQAWHPFNQFISQRTDKHSTLQKGHLYCPVISLGTLLYQIRLMIDNAEGDIFGRSDGLNAIRLLDLLGYGDFRWLIDVPSTQDFVDDYKSLYDTKYVNIFRLAAYQHIWYDYYRNKYYDVESETGGIIAAGYESDYVYSFNFDDIICDTFANSVINSGNHGTSEYKRVSAMLGLRYIQWKKDVFTSSMPGQQFGVVSSVDISNVNLVDSSGVSGVRALTRNSNGSVSLSSVVTNGSAPSSWISAPSQFSIPSAFDVLALRKSEALQQWKTNTLRAGNMTDDSFKSHYGVEPYYNSDENVHYLGSYSAALQVNSVEATAYNGLVSGLNNHVGDLAATGTIFVQNGDKIKFDAKDFGIIMCIASYLPESEYSSNALDKANTLYEQFDFFTPEFQNIGLEAVSLHEVTLDDIPLHNFNQVIGYAPRYYMYKQAVDKVFGEFKPVKSLQPVGGSALSKAGSLTPWVTPRTEDVDEANNRMYISNYYVDPSVYDNCFAINTDADQSTDNFIHNVYFDIKAIRPMTVLGLPQF